MKALKQAEPKGSVEVKMSDTYTVTGGARVGNDFSSAMRVTWPLASLVVDNKHVILEILGTRYTFERQLIQSMHRFRVFFSSGVRIIHSKEDNPKFVVFYPLSFNTLKKNLARLGYVVED